MDRRGIGLIGSRLRKVALVGYPNVGKSSIFNILTKNYVNVSNYPGTTVDISRSCFRVGESIYEVVDTPGAYSLLPITEEEEVTRSLLFEEKFDVVVHIVDAKNIRRMLVMTLDLIDGGFNVILVLNVMDEALKLGMKFNIEGLEKMLGIPVIATSIKNKASLEKLKTTIINCPANRARPFCFSKEIEDMIQAITATIDDSIISNRLAAILMLKQDKKVINLYNISAQTKRVIKEFTERHDIPLDYIMLMERQKTINQIIDGIVKDKPRSPKSLAIGIGKWSREPLTGIPILVFVLYFGFYKIVGQFGAGWLVDYLDSTIFAQYVNPVVLSFFYKYISSDVLRSLFIGEYGIYTIGFRYATVIVLPIVGTFFIVFSILEDCGYLPRLAMLSDRFCKYIGLNGRFIVPLTLGFGCGTMAVVVTRTLETKRERLVATFLIALAVPCSAQLGLVLALLSYNTLALWLWAITIITVFIGAGLLCSKLYKDEHSAFYIELPPIRMPMLGNVIMKSYTRMLSYYLEILPVFIVTSIILWGCNLSGLLTKLLVLIRPLARLLGLPQEAGQVFLYGFFRRDYGAAGLYDLFSQGMLNDRQVLVSAVTLTLFVPCVAQMSVMIKERGLGISIIMFVAIITTAFLVGWLLNNLLLKLFC